MKIFVYEFRKVIRQKSVWVLWILCLFLNVLFLNVTEQNRHSYTPEMYRELDRDLAQKTENEALEWLTGREQELREQLYTDPEFDGQGNYELYTGNAWDELDLLSDAASEREKVLHYSSYLDSIRQDAETMLSVSIFQNSGGFAARNIQKTAADFSKMRSVMPRYDTTRGITLATGFLPTDFLAVFLLFAAGVFLVLNEKQQGLFELICHTAKGRREMIAAKLGVLAVCTVLILAGLYAGNLLSAGYLYGFGDPGRPVQSVDAYQSSILPITVGQYLCLFLGWKLLVYLTVGIIFFFICLRFRQLAGILLTVTGIMAGSAACYYLIPDNSAFFSIKYLNLFYFLRTDRLLMCYKNISLFGKPVQALPVAAVICAVLLGMMFFMNLRIIQTRRVFQKGGSIRPRKELSEQKTLRFCSLKAFEYQKIMRKTGAVFLLILFFVFQCARVFQYSDLGDADEVYYRSYMQYLEGTVTDRTEAYVREERARYDELLNVEQAQDQIQSNRREQTRQALRPYRAWQKVEEQYERVAQDQEFGFALPLVYEKGYEQLMGDNAQMDLAEICLIALLFCLCFASSFGGDSSIGMDLLIQTAAGGRKDTVRAKQSVTFFWAVVIFLLVYGTDFLKIFLKVGMSVWTAPVRSLQMFAAAEIPIRIWQYFLFLYLLRFLGMTVMLYMIWNLSRWCKDSFHTILFHLIIFMLPAVCGLIGIDAVENITLCPLLCGNTLLNLLITEENAVPVIIYSAIAVSIILLSDRFALRAGRD